MSAALQELVGWVTLVTAPFTVYGAYVVVQNRRDAKRGKPLTHLYPLLRPQGLGAAETIAEKGRVPLSYNTGSNVASAWWNVGRRLMLRPSSPKPAFAIMRFEPDYRPGESDSGWPGDRRMLRAELHPNESAKHFVRSFMMQLTSGGRVVAVCDPDDLGRAKARVRCHLAEGIENRKQIRAMPDQPSVVLRYADPDLHPRGREWKAKSSKVPSDAIWLVQSPPNSRGNYRDPPRFESRLAGRPRRRYFWLLMFFLLVFPLLAIALAVLLYGLETFASRATGTDPPGSSTTALDALYGIYSIGVTLALIACVVYLLGLVISIWREERESCRWRAGTTECILDGDRARNLA